MLLTLNGQNQVKPKEKPAETKVKWADKLQEQKKDLASVILEPKQEAGRMPAVTVHRANQRRNLKSIMKAVPELAAGTESSEVNIEKILEEVKEKEANMQQQKKEVNIDQEKELYFMSKIPQKTKVTQERQLPVLLLPILFVEWNDSEYNK
jgi:hypothetical protein